MNPDQAKGLRHYGATLRRVGLLFFILGGIYGVDVYNRTQILVSDAVASYQARQKVEVVKTDTVKTVPVKPKESRAEYWRRKSLEKTARFSK